MKYKTKPIIIEAECWYPEMGTTVKGVILYQPDDTVIGGKGHGITRFPQKPYFACLTKNGAVKPNPGDYIITLEDGESYPCDPDVFNNKYEPVNE